MESTPFSIGVISAYNPPGIKSNRKANLEAQRMLKRQLDGMRLKYVERQGAYLGKSEKYLVVRNISRRELIRLADNYQQDAVLYAEQDKDDYVFEWIEDGKTKKKKRAKAKWPVSVPRFAK